MAVDVVGMVVVDVEGMVVDTEGMVVDTEDMEEAVVEEAMEAMEAVEVAAQMETEA